MIEFNNVSMKFDGRAVLSALNFSIEPGAFVCITGPSGAGKSTVFNLLVRVMIPTSGSIIIDGADLSLFPDAVLQLYRKKTGVLYQDYKLLPHLTAEENVALPLEVIGTESDNIDSLVQEAMQRFRIEERAESFPHELSGGEKTRVALARAVIHKPSILLVDEPTGNIDPKQSLEILRFIREIHAEGTTVIIATHDKNVVDILNVRVMRLENGAIVRDSIGGYDEVKKDIHVQTEESNDGQQNTSGTAIKVGTEEQSAPKKPASKIKPIAI